MKGKKKTWEFGSTFVRVKPCEYHLEPLTKRKRIRLFKNIQVLRTDSHTWIPELQGIKWNFKGKRVYKLWKSFLVYQYEKMTTYRGLSAQPLIYYHIPSGRFYSLRKYLSYKRYRKPMKKLNVQATFIARQLKYIGVINYERRETY